jgi:adenylate kinase family enzyme
MRLGFGLSHCSQAEPAGAKKQKPPGSDGKDTKKTLSKQAIGSKLQLIMMEGQVPDDNLLVSLLIEAMSQEPPTPGGWMIIDFPKTRQQAQILERELSGFAMKITLDTKILNKQRRVT